MEKTMKPEDNPADERYEIDLCIEEIKSLKRQLAASQGDAERYRFIRDKLAYICAKTYRTGGTDLSWSTKPVKGDSFDAAIDALMTKDPDHA